MIEFNSHDLWLITQPILDFKLRLEVYDKMTDSYLDVLDGAIMGGSSSIDSNSDIRRTMSIQIQPQRNNHIVFEPNSLLWLNRYIKLYIGIKDQRSGEYRWFNHGIYSYQNINTTYDSTTNQLDLSLSDRWTDLDGTTAGELYTDTEYPYAELDSETGEVIHYNYIRDKILATLSVINIQPEDCEISEIGEINGMAEYNPIGYKKYREQSCVPVKDGTLEPTWNAMPFTLEFSPGTTFAGILTTFRDLYPNYEMFFNEEGTFVCQLIPSRDEDDPIITEEYFRKIVISENTSTDLTSVRNVQMVFGESIQTDYYTEDCSLTNSTYIVTCEGYEEKYYNGDKIAMLIQDTNPYDAMINVNGFGEIPIYDENTDKPLESNTFEVDNIYVFKIKSKYVDGASVMRAYWLGHYQAQGMYVLTDGSVGIRKYIPETRGSAELYSKEYFQQKYNCENVEMEIVKDSDFVVQRLDIKLGVKSGSEYETCTSNSLALARARYELYKSARLTDNITLVTKLCPFADVNIKVSYRRSDRNYAEEYIVKSLSHDWSNGQTTWTLMKFYPLYQES